MQQIFYQIIKANVLVIEGMISIRLVYAPVAQMEEHRTFNAGVLGSSPSRRTSRFIILLIFVSYAIQGYANRPIIEDA